MIATYNRLTGETKTLAFWLNCFFTITDLIANEKAPRYLNSSGWGCTLLPTRYFWIFWPKTLISDLFGAHCHSCCFTLLQTAPMGAEDRCWRWMTQKLLKRSSSQFTGASWNVNWHEKREEAVDQLCTKNIGEFFGRELILDRKMGKIKAHVRLFFLFFRKNWYWVPHAKEWPSRRIKARGVKPLMVMERGSIRGGVSAQGMHDLQSARSPLAFRPHLSSTENVWCIMKRVHYDR